MHRNCSLTLLSVAFMACSSPQREAEPAGNEADVRERVQRIARDYPSWGELDTALRVAPFDCRGPRVTSAGSFTFSFAESGPHKAKLYRLYARDPAAYRGLESGAAQRDQVLVKETFEAKPFTMSGPGEPPKNTVWTQEGGFRPGAAAGLFVMMRDSSAASDESAWTYATVAPTGELTAVGRIDSCMRCHREAPYGGLFGLER